MLGNNLAGGAAGNVAGAHEERLEGAVGVVGAATGEGAGGELEQRGAFAFPLRGTCGLLPCREGCRSGLFCGVGQNTRSDGGRVVFLDVNGA